MFALAIPHGGHISHGKLKWGGTAGVVRHLDVKRYEFDEENFEIDLDGTRKRIEKVEREEGKKPKIFMLGASVFLFPHPVKEIKELAGEYGAKVVYDAAHVAGLIAGKIFQDPLREGADAVTLSTHKTLAGPQHGMLLSWKKYEEELFIDGMYGNQAFNEANFRLQGAYKATYMNVTKYFYYNHWTPENPTNKFGNYTDQIRQNISQAKILIPL